MHSYHFAPLVSVITKINNYEQQKKKSISKQNYMTSKIGKIVQQMFFAALSNC